MPRAGPGPGPRHPVVHGPLSDLALATSQGAPTKGPGPSLSGPSGLPPDSLYTLVGKSEMGHGTFGQVFLAVYRPNGAMCAAKFHDIDCAIVTREVELLKALQADPHPNIMGLYDVRVDISVVPPRLVLLCELCDMDLRRYLKARGG